MSGEKIIIVSPTNDDELSALRSRAYGPDADIHLDPPAGERLRELESAARGQQSSARAQTPDPTLTPEPAPESLPEPVSLQEDSPPRPDHSRSRMRRTRAIVVIGAAGVALALALGVFHVQPAPTEPLQSGAREITRLTVDPTYKISTYFFGTAFGRDLEAQGFQDFHGLRAVVTVGYGSVFTDDCLSIYPTSVDADPTTSSPSGQLRVSCAAGAFPARVQFRLDAAGVPADARAAFPDSVALQFVYDRTSDEVVVLAEK